MMSQHFKHYTKRPCLWVFMMFLATSTMAQTQIYHDILVNPTDPGLSYQSNSKDERKFIPSKRIVAISDSTFLVSGRVLMNLDADGYIITFGLNQQSESLLACAEAMNLKIAGFISQVQGLGISDNDIYVDMIAQYPVYGYDIEKKIITQQQEGYEINKNLIVRFDSLSLIGQLLQIAAQQGIHNAVKLDYIINDLEAVYDTLFSIAKNIINKKKTLYLQATNLAIQNQAVIFSEQFQIVFPNQLYKSYQAYESADLEHYGRRSKYAVESERKKTTRYYDGISYSGFDKYIYPDKVAIGLQAIFELEIKYQREKE